MMSSKKDYIGRVMAQRPALLDAGPAGAGRLQARSIARRGCAPARISCRVGARRPPSNDEGYMTSVAFSPMLGHWIGLGVLQRGPQRIGERVRAYDPVRNGDVEVEICDPVFFDSERVRLNA